MPVAYRKMPLYQASGRIIGGLKACGLARHVTQDNICTTIMHKGGRPRDPIWEQFVLVEEGCQSFARCKLCRKQQSGKVYRMKEHYQKCMKTSPAVTPDGITSCPPLPMSAPRLSTRAGHDHHLPLIGHGRAGSGC